MEPLEMSENSNREFYSNCTTYFAALQKQGKTDIRFEDEFYYTMPAVSAKE